MGGLGFLHLSDLHVRTLGGTLWQDGQIRGAMEGDLAWLCDRMGPIDVVFVSGDLAYTGIATGYGLVTDVLGSLFNFLARIGSRPALLAVPGNWDLVRAPSMAPYVERWAEDPATREAFFQDEEHPLRKAVVAAFEPFTRWHELFRREFPGSAELDVTPGLLPGDFAATLRCDDVRYGIVGLNTAFLDIGSADAHGHLDVDARQIEPAVGDLSRFAEDHEACVLVTHHPPAALAEPARARFFQTIAPDRRFALHLAGGLRGAPAPIEDAPSTVFFQANPLSLDFSRTSARGYAVGRIEAGSPRYASKVTLWPRRLITAPHGQPLFSADPDVGDERIERTLHRAPPPAPLEAEMAARIEDDAFAEPVRDEKVALFDGDAFPEPQEAKKAEAPPPPPAKPVPLAKPAVAAFAPGSARSSAPARARTPVAKPAPAATPVPAQLDIAHELELTGSLTLERGPLARLRFSPRGDLIAGITYWGRIFCWETASHKRRSSARAGAESLDLGFSPDGKRFATRSGTSLSLWDTNTGKELRQVHDLAGTSLAWSPDNVLAAGLPNGTIRFFDGDDLAPLGTLDHGFCPDGVFALAFSPSGDFLLSGGKGDGFVAISTIPAGALPHQGFTRAAHFHRHGGSILDFAFRPGSHHVASAADEGSIAVWSLEDGSFLARLEAHGSAVTSVSFSHDGRLLASRARDGAVILWRTDVWEPVQRLRSATNYLAGAAFSPTEPLLAVPSPTGSIALFHVDIDALCGRGPASSIVHTRSAKVVLLGEGRAGKSCLALRLAKDEYEPQPVTHGMRFWTIGEDRLPREGFIPKNHRREIVVWDLGGQDEYRLVHPLFLRDASLALLVFEPERGKDAEDEIASWNDRLAWDEQDEIPPRRMLVGTKMDDPARSSTDRHAIDRLRVRTGAGSYVPTSAREGRGIRELLGEIAAAVDWSALGPTSHPALFERIRAHIERARKTGRAVLPLPELEEELRASEKDPDLQAAVTAVASKLARQGFVAEIRLSDGTRALVLDVEQIARYAGSLILLARQNAHGVPAVELASLLGPGARFPRIPPGERLRKDQELGVLDGVVALLIAQGTCFLEGGLLVFPGLLPAAPEGEDAEGPALPAAIRYEMSRPAAEVYASAACALALGRRFGPARLGPGRADFGLPGDGLSRLSIAKAPLAKARGGLEVAFSPDTPDHVRRLFAGFLEDHLRMRGVHFVEDLAVRCPCGYVLPVEVVRGRLVAGHTDVGCPECDTRTQLVPPSEEGDAPRSKVFALRREADRAREASVTAARITLAAHRTRDDAERAPPPIRVLHLSDLHVRAGDDPATSLEPLLTDLRDRVEGLALEKLDFVVVSGDLTNRASAGELEKARALLSRLCEEMSLSTERCIVVPGNHDLDWDTEVYDFKKKRAVDPSRLAPGSFVTQENGYLVRDDARYPTRFRPFSDHLYHPLCLRPYPLAPEEQGLSHLFAAERIQFVTLNSSVHIDELHANRAAIHPGALSRALAEASRQVDEARGRGDLEENTEILRLAVFHHPVTGNDKIEDDAFLDRLRRADVRAVLHGHVHEDRADLVGYLHPTRRLHVIGAGSFGAPAEGRPESTPRLYNLLTIQRDLGLVRVDTRCLRRDTGAWEAFAVWPGQKPGERRAFYEIKLH